MDIRKVLTLRGPNAWGLNLALEAWIDLQQQSAVVDDHPRLREQVIALCTAMHGSCDRGCEGRAEPLPPLHSENNVLMLIGRTALELSASCGSPNDYLKIVPLGEAGVFRLLVGYQHEDLGRACLDLACDLAKRALAGETHDVAEAYRQLREAVPGLVPAPSVAALHEALQARQLPILALPRERQHQIGWGNRQRRISGLLSDRASAVALQVAHDERTARRLLRASGAAVWDPDSDAPVVVLRDFHALVVGDQIAAVVEATKEGVVEFTGRLPQDTLLQLTEGVKMLGLDVAAVEFVAVDPAEALDEKQGGLVRVAAPESLDTFFRIHEALSTRLANVLADHVLSGGSAGRIPVITITGTNGKTTTTRLCAHIVAQSGKRVGMTCTDGIYIHGRRIDSDDCSGPKSARNVLLNPTVEAAVLETARGGILREGMAVDFCDVAVVTNIGEGDHLGLNGIDTVDQLARVKRTIVDAVAPKSATSPGGTAVLKADDPLTAEMAAFCPGSVVFFCRDSEHPVMVKHRSEGGRVVFVRENFVVLAEGTNLEIPLLSLDRIPLTHRGRIWFQVENVLAATAANWALGIPAEVIRNGLESFGGSITKSPGRFNLLTIRGATVICDYGHNTSSLQAMLEVLQQFSQARRLALYTAAGDRRDVDMIEQGRMLGQAFDEVYLYEDQYMRGREKGEIMQLFQQGLDAGQRVKKVQAVQGWNNAVDAVLASAQSGDLVLLQADTIDEAVEVVGRILASDPSAREVSFQEALAPSQPVRTV